MRTIHATTLLFFLPAMAQGVEANPTAFNGVPIIIDGDTVQFGSTKLQLEGADAPQIDQPCFDKAGARWKCGIAAREQLKSQAGGKTWTCKAARKNRYGRLLASCQASGEDVARQMVKNGWALASTSGSAAYLESEELARGSGSGLWAGAFVAPLDWRQQNFHAKIFGQATASTQSSAALLSSAFGGASPPSPNCAIKGNVNWGGKCIFHKPDGHWYKRITMEAKYGDRWFCSAAEALESGCRETKR